MNRLVGRVRDLAEACSAEFGLPIDAMIRDGMLGVFAVLVLAIDVLLLAGGGR